MEGICSPYFNSSALREEILPLCGKEGIEINRKGGSSGRTKISDDFFDFLKSERFPIKPEKVKIFQNDLTWSGVYIKTQVETRQAACFAHSQPQKGGRFKMPKHLILQEEVLQRFTLFKIQSAHILQAVDPFISPGAVKTQMEENEAARDGSDCLLDMIIKLSLSNHHTLVQHPVGYHNDVFTGNVPKLENKMCFIDSLARDAVGRGGAGPSKFVWSLLDW